MNDNEIKTLLQNSKTIAMIGISSEKKGEDRKNLAKDILKSHLLAVFAALSN